ncbi:MAG TPA: hypothetical protein VL262_00145 [Vicinamibacterales bacterium]|nr:hypothetical protein [Vicinamibacterales bacterium]
MDLVALFAGDPGRSLAIPGHGTVTRVWGRAPAVAALTRIALPARLFAGAEIVAIGSQTTGAVVQGHDSMQVANWNVATIGLFGREILHRSYALDVLGGLGSVREHFDINYVDRTAYEPPSGHWQERATHLAFEAGAHLRRSVSPSTDLSVSGRVIIVRRGPQFRYLQFSPAIYTLGCGFGFRL